MQSIIILGVIITRILGTPNMDLSKFIGEQWFGLYLNQNKVGYMCQKVALNDEGNLLITEEGTFKINMSGVKQDMKILSIRTYSSSGNLISIKYEMSDAISTTEFIASAINGQLKLTKTIAGQTTEKILPPPKETVKDALKFQIWMREKPELNAELISFYFEPLYEQELTCVSTVENIEERFFNGAPTKVYKIKTKINIINLEQTSYVTENGLVLEDMAGEIFTMRLEPMEVAKDVTYSNDVLVSNAAIVDKQISNPRTRETLKLIIRGPLKESHLFCDERQQLVANGDHFIFTAKKIDPNAILKIPYPIQDEEVRRWSEPSSFVQSDHPEMKNKAKEIVEDTKDTWEAVKKLCDWVNNNMRTTYSAQLTNSLDVLRHLEGDCTEHSILFVGLARALGIPAREVSGLVYVDHPKPGFYFHQWAKVWVGKWIDVDPTFGQTTVDVTHIKIGEGDLIDQIKLIPLIGKIQISVVE
ncbi:MAG: transglutaminase-like domain-containing protein [Candidatus Hydrogenedentes bacterium]|nr:transglutaminase-like domain-containing protein [Candidatus Hydrogenedentota bacterium]